MSNSRQSIEGLPLADLPFVDLLSLSTLTLATASRECAPHAAPVYFAADENLRLYFFSDPHSRHGQDLAVNPIAAAAIYPECFDWQDIRGLQMRGQVTRVDQGQDWEHAWDAFATKFPFVMELREVVANNQFYCFTPSWIRLVDNRRGFGYKQEWELP